jgi:hypothetical protein
MKYIESRVESSQLRSFALRRGTRRCLFGCLRSLTTSERSVDLHALAIDLFGRVARPIIYRSSRRSRSVSHDAQVESFNRPRCHQCFRKSGHGTASHEARGRDKDMISDRRSFRRVLGRAAALRQPASLPEAYGWSCVGHQY